MFSVRRALALLGLALLLLLCSALPASAHVRDSTGYSTIHGDGAEISYTLSLEYDILARAVDLGPKALEAADDGERAAVLEAGRENIAAYIDERVVLFLDGAACEPELAGTSVGEREESPYADLHLTYSCPGSSGGYTLTYDVFSEADAAADGHTNIVDYQLGGTEGRTVLDGSHREFAVGDSSVLDSSTRFGFLGFSHILSGLDHVLFVAALIFGATSLRNMLGVLSMFTLAHSVTLISALLGWVTVPAAVVEPLIALSIVFVALENLLGASHRRLPVVFVFGLLHGLGFAGSLRITDEVSWNLVASLLSFNIGIEAGQALLALAAFPLLTLLRRTRWSVPVLRGATVLVATFGLIWFIERFFLA